MRILHISADALVGGAESFLITLARNKALDPISNHEFAFTARGPALDAITLAGGAVHYLGSASHRHVRNLLATRRRLYELCAENKYDVAVFHQYPYLIAALADVLWRRKVKTVRFYHNETVPNSKFEWLVRHVYPSDAHRAVVNSKFLLQSIPGAKGTVVYCPVDRQIELTDVERKQIRALLDTPFEEPLVVQVCRMEERKGHARLLRSLAVLKSLSWNCWIVGGPQKDKEVSYFARLKALAVELGIGSRVRFLGLRTDVPKLLAAADIFCHPNIHPPEPFGIALVEALQAGLPVVTTAMGGALEIVSAQCGFLVPPEDDIALTQALQSLLTNEDLRRRMSTSARTRGDLFTASVQIPLLNAALQAAAL